MQRVHSRHNHGRGYTLPKLFEVYLVLLLKPLQRCEVFEHILWYLIVAINFLAVIAVTLLSAEFDWYRAAPVSSCA